ncbi:MAG: TonB-dependent siderophore receptor [Cyanobacteria bacterium P01_D01_bin.115]
MGLRSPHLLAAVVVALVGFPLQAQANEMIAESEGEPVDEAIASQPLRPPTDEVSVPTAEELEGEPAAEAELPIDVSAHPTLQPSTSQAATTVEEWVAQIEASLVQIIDVRVEDTEAGLQIVLETAEGELAASTTQTVGNALIADIPNAVLALSSDDSFEQFSPAEGIALVSVTNEPGDQVRVAITGTDAPPVGEVTTTGLTVTLGEVVAGAGDDAIQVVVTGEGDEGYNPSNASSVTGTDTPLRDIPFSVQVIPEAVLDDRNVTELGEALETAGGVTPPQGRGSASGGPFFTIRGLDATVLQDGFRGFSFAPLSTNDLERIEVLRGPASVLSAQGGLGGTVNLVSKRPLSEPFYEVSASVGSFETYRGAVDLSGPLNESRSVRYRLNLSYENLGSFRDFVDGERLLISPIITWDIGQNTSLDVYGRYTYDRETFDDGIPFTSEGEPVDVPRSRFLNEDWGEFTQDLFSVGYRLNHNFSENWSVRHTSEYAQNNPRRYYPSFGFAFDFDEVTGEIGRVTNNADGTYHRFFTNAEVLGRFNTGNIQHQLLFGVEYRYEAEDPGFQFGQFYPSINVFNPVYTNEPFERAQTFFRDDNIDNIGVYVQNQMEITPELKALVGLRFDYADQFRSTQNLGEPREEFTQTDTAFSPRLGVVYQPIEPLSLYASYSTQFSPSGAFNLNADDSTFDPEEGRQFEVGLKADLSSQLSLNLAAFDIRRQNVSTPDPNNPAFSIQTGEVASRGIDFYLNGEILPGWNITTAYTYLDAFVSKDNGGTEGNQLGNVPEHQFSLWTTYEIQQGDLEGLGAGLGFFYVGERPGDTGNTFTLPSYFRTDAALFYKQDNWRAQINFENLFDIEYFTSANYEIRESVNPGQPFGVTASLSINF